MNTKPTVLNGSIPDAVLHEVFLDQSGLPLTFSEVTPDVRDHFNLRVRPPFAYGVGLDVLVEGRA